MRVSFWTSCAAFEVNASYSPLRKWINFTMTFEKIKIYDKPCNAHLLRQLNVLLCISLWTANFFQEWKIFSTFEDNIRIAACACAPMKYPLHLNYVRTSLQDLICPGRYPSHYCLLLGPSLGQYCTITFGKRLYLILHFQCSPLNVNIRESKWKLLVS